MINAGRGFFTMKYFKIDAEGKGLETIDDLKRQFKRLAVEHHPDKGGNTAIFQDILNEYQNLLDRFERGFKMGAASDYNAFCSGFSQALAEMWERIKDGPGEAEICGEWIWVKVDKELRGFYKDAGFKFHWDKLLWFWHDPEYKRARWHGEAWDMETIRDKHGSIKMGAGRKAIK